MLAVSQWNGASGIFLTLESWGLDSTALLSGLGVSLLWGLVRPWGQVFPRWTLFLHGRPVPRWFPLAPALPRSPQSDRPRPVRSLPTGHPWGTRLATQGRADDCARPWVGTQTSGQGPRLARPHGARQRDPPGLPAPMP
ncbi:hypothetical protein [Streptomyces sp. RKAG293]|uniref:hypothetical protein n=1 Tax=Streptomyces sp. RKAG293 TaxID=2893403 RepID=UPI002033C351|nr:hypothetical protein [Streptomyces sp. RKAG293]MCM2422702.1 hypothetical protein [Streptomyces sp. RKAG293]